MTNIGGGGEQVQPGDTAKTEKTAGSIPENTKDLVWQKAATRRWNFQSHNVPICCFCQSCRAGGFCPHLHHRAAASPPALGTQELCQPPGGIPGAWLSRDSPSLPFCCPPLCGCRWWPGCTRAGPAAAGTGALPGTRGTALGKHQGENREQLTAAAPQSPRAGPSLLTDSNHIKSQSGWAGRDL